MDDEHAPGADDAPARRSIPWPAVAGVLAVAVALLTGYLLGTRGSTAPTTAAAPPPASTTTVAPSPTTTSAPPTTTTSTAPPVACGVDLTASAVTDAVATLAPEPRTGRPFSVAGVRGNYDPCVTLSTALVYVDDATGGSPVQALLFHDGTYVGTATSTAYGFTSLNAPLSVDDTVALSYKTGGSCNACTDGTITTVRYQWDGSAVQMLDDLPSRGGAAVTSAPSTTEPVCRGVNCPAPGVVGNVGGPRSRGVAWVSCPLDQELGTGLYADGQLDYAPECLPGGSGGR